MSSVNIATKTIVLGPNAPLTVNVTGQYFYCLSATQPFSMSIDGTQEISIVQGLGFPTTTQFKTLVFRDTSGAGCSISFITGSEAVTYQAPSFSVTTKNAPTYAKGSGITAIADGALSALFSGLDTGANAGKVRKQIAVSNLGATLLFLSDAAGNNGVQIPSNQSVTFEVSGGVKVENIAGSGAGSFSVMEIFYS